VHELDPVLFVIFVSLVVSAQAKRREAMITIKKVTTAEQDTAVSAIVKGFGADPATRWMYPDSQQYCEHFQSFVKAFAGAAFEHGSADLVDGCLAVALWLPPGIHPDEEAMEKLIRTTVPERDQTNVFELFEQMDRFHPAESHWYLPMIGVDPAHQHKGFGSALLQHGLARCDREGKLAYLESTSPRSLQLYQRHGFELLGTIQVGSSPELFPMLRKPRAIWRGANNLRSNHSSAGWAQL
jgi:ribosomal protein S18 acetylase RimI-like enzyme